MIFCSHCFMNLLRDIFSEKLTRIKNSWKVSVCISAVAVDFLSGKYKYHQLGYQVTLAKKKFVIYTGHCMTLLIKICIEIAGVTTALHCVFSC
jgi:hypothetical protein